MDISALCSLTAALKENISKVIMGKEEQIEKILLCLYSGRPYPVGGYPRHWKDHVGQSACLLAGLRI